jgi:hypothetical protein
MSMPGVRASLLKMNRRQTRAFIAGFAILLFMGFYPPWVHEYRNEVGGRRTVSAGFGTLISPPAAMSTQNLHGTHVDLVLLLAEWLVASGVTFGVVVWLADRRTEKPGRLRHHKR